ncbi:MAG: IS110 family transposase [bacterium]
MTVYVGLDVHRKRTQVAILDEEGGEVLNRNVQNDPTELAAILGSLDAGTSVAFEAAYGWGWLAELLEELGLDAHLANPGRCKAIASARLKNDKVDARMLAHLLRADLLAEAWIAPKDVRDQRALLRHRISLVRMRSSLQARIHAVLADAGIREDLDSLWTRQGRAWLASVELPAARRAVVDDCLGLIDALNVPIRRIQADIKRSPRTDPRIAALTKLYGIGPLTAMLLVAEIGDIKRFPSARKLCSWAGLTPSVRNSDRTVRHGHITKQGSPYIRWAMVEAAHVAKRRPPFSRFFAETAQRRGRKIATVAVARKLLARAFHVLKEVEFGADPSVGCARFESCA